jgi:hypothetical protein
MMYNKVILLKPNHLNAYNEKGRCLARLSRFNEAIGKSNFKIYLYV